MPPGVLASSFALLVGLSQLQELAEPDVIAANIRFDDATDFAFHMKGIPARRQAGALRWDIPVRVLYTGGLDRQFDSYSADPFVGVRMGVEYPFALGTIDRPAVMNLPDDDPGRALAERKTRYVRELYGRFYPDPAKPVVGNRAAFQIALWELLWETDVPDGPMPFNLLTGTFRGEDATSAVVRQAQEYLLVLTGDEQQFEKNLLLWATDLIRLDGLKTADGEPAQSQIVLRLRSGTGDGGRGSTGIGSGPVGSGLLGGGGVLGRPTGFPGGGLTPGGPSGGGFSAPGLIGNPSTGTGGGGGGGNPGPNPNPGGGGSIDVPPTPPVTVPPLGGDRDPPPGGAGPGGGDNPGGGGTDPGGGSNPGGGIKDPGTDPPPVDPIPAVPAPGGLVIGLIGATVLAVRRGRISRAVLRPA